MASTRVWLLAVVLACVLLVKSADGATEAAAPAPSKGPVFGCNPLTDKACKVLPGGGIDLDGDGDEDELPSFSPHFNILGHGH
ncbi:hypothetical protein PR202_ga06732 [Eleusine coracana subsp. coracana]|uniref:Uncharacterized protein n=1 Tax=Eleusine coracana subsp. coracana TaxID=191504 RepID=A0AAV5BVQ3_ELECO|nr:hypothetical protein PR202_ga06732 [Eleusine coracana subsp. coracana]